MTAELEHRLASGLPTDALPANLDAGRHRLADLESLARRQGLDPREIQRRHGRLNVLEVCKRHGIEKAYYVDFAFDSAHVHEKNAATSTFVTDLPSERRFSLGPEPASSQFAMVDSLKFLGRVFVLAAEILGDPGLLDTLDQVGMAQFKIEQRMMSRLSDGH